MPARGQMAANRPAAAAATASATSQFICPTTNRAAPSTTITHITATSRTG
jgi:hypothetical protein